MTIYNIFIISSPLQMLNAHEAISHFKIKNNILLLIKNEEGNNTNQIISVLNESYWHKIIRIPTTKSSKFFKYLSLLKELKTFNFDKLFLGDFGIIHQIIVANIKHKKTILLDDGTATISYHHNLIKRHRKKINFRKIRFNLFGYKTKIKQTIHCFTIFKLIAKKNQEIIPNEYNLLKKQYNISQFEKDDNVYFLGSLLIDSQTIEVSTFENYIKQIILHFKGRKIIYIAHRATQNLNVIENFSSNQFEIRHSTIPVELMFLEKRIYPAYVVSTMSTALFTLDKIFDKTKIIAFKMPQKDLLNYHRIMEESYKNLAYTNVELINLSKS